MPLIVVWSKRENHASESPVERDGSKLGAANTVLPVWEMSPEYLQKLGLGRRERDAERLLGKVPRVSEGGVVRGVVDDKVEFEILGRRHGR